MIIDTDIKTVNEDGNQGFLRAYSIKELEKVMELENISECKIKVYAQSIEMLSKSITLEDVKTWSNSG